MTNSSDLTIYNDSANLFSNATGTDFTDLTVFPPEIELIMKVVYVIVTITGLLGNCIIMFLFGSKMVKLTAFNILLLSLTISDIFAGLSVWAYIFIDLKWLRNYEKATADFLCNAVNGQLTFWIATSGSIFSLSAISVSRYIFIRHPLKMHLFKRKYAAVAVLLVIWPAAIAVAIPNSFSMQYERTHAICIRVWPNGINGRIYSVVSACIGYFVPMCLLVLTLISTRQQLWLPKNADKTVSRVSIAQRKKAAVFLGRLILAFFFFFSPMFGYWIVSRTLPNIFPPEPELSYVQMRIVRVTFLILMCNTVADPIIYSLRCEGFKDSLLRIWKRLPRFSVKRTAAMP